MTWESIYSFLHITDFIYFISSPELQDMLFPVKLVFVFCAAFFFVFVIYFMINSSWMESNFLQDVGEFFSWQAYGQRETFKQWNRIKRRIQSGLESDYKLAIIDADDFLLDVLDSAGYEAKDFKESIAKAGKLLAPILSDVLAAHEARNSIVYNPEYKVSTSQVNKILDTYEAAIKNIGSS